MYNKSEIDVTTSNCLSGSTNENSQILDHYFFFH